MEEHGIRPVWFHTSTTTIAKVSEEKWTELYKSLEEKNVSCETPIRIRTPKESSDSENEEQTETPKAPKASIASIASRACVPAKVLTTLCEFSGCCCMIVGLFYIYGVLLSAVIS
jgi:hypothetical protein